MEEGTNPCAVAEADIREKVSLSILTVHLDCTALAFHARRSVERPALADVRAALEDLPEGGVRRALLELERPAAAWERRVQDAYCCSPCNPPQT